MSGTGNTPSSRKDGTVSLEREAARLAVLSLKDYQTYLTLLEGESDPALRQLLAELAQNGKEIFSFWGRKGMVRGDVAQPRSAWFFRMYRRVCGASRTLASIVHRERAKVSAFEVYCVDCLDAEERKAIEVMLTRSRALIDAYDKSTKK